MAIYGDNYDVYPLLDFAKVLDWEVSLVGNIQKMNKEKLIGIQKTFQKEHKPRPDFDDRTAAILMAHDFETDIKNLKILLQTPVRYIGLLGPRKRYDKILSRLEEEGLHSLSLTLNAYTLLQVLKLEQIHQKRLPPAFVPKL